MQLINDGKINTIVFQQPLFEVKEIKNEWEYYIDKFTDKINNYLISANRKPWDKKRITLRLRMARVKNHHIREFYEECEDRGDKFGIHFFSKTKVTWKQTIAN